MANKMKNQGMLTKARPAGNEKMKMGKMKTANKGKLPKSKMPKGKC